MHNVCKNNKDNVNLLCVHLSIFYLFIKSKIFIKVTILPLLNNDAIITNSQTIKG